MSPRAHLERHYTQRIGWLRAAVLGANDGSVVQQTAIFEPRGLAGLLYWYSLYPLHGLIFAGMLRGIARAAERRAAPERLSAR